MVVSFVRVASLECTAEAATIGLLLCVPFLHPCRARRSAPPRPFGAEVVPSGGPAGPTEVQFVLPFSQL